MGKIQESPSRPLQVKIRRCQVTKIKRLIEIDYPFNRIAEIAGLEHVKYIPVVLNCVTGYSSVGSGVPFKVSRRDEHLEITAHYEIR